MVTVCNGEGSAEQPQNSLGCTQLAVKLRDWPPGLITTSVKQCMETFISPCPEVQSIQGILIFIRCGICFSLPYLYVCGLTAILLCLSSYLEEASSFLRAAELFYPPPPHVVVGS